MQTLARPGDSLFIGGKSMGGRIASQIATRLGHILAGVVVLGYPLHPPGKPGQLRISHLDALSLPVLIVQGSRDSFGTPAELRRWFTKPGMSILEVKGGDHSFRVLKSSQRSQAEVYSEIQDKIRDWIVEQIKAGASGT
ncbi:MAG TPA: hypothetical protein PLP42_06675 [Acidobacteriota bacterium]|jgi:hypothetical protein|nr:hypothetical protein [Acidobacteriota bacterium]